MGVPGLWDVLKPAAESRSLAQLATQGFEENKASKRALRIGVDASIWMKHAEGGRGGENPVIRTLFFRLCSYHEFPVLLLVIFDGRSRPKVKRGSKMGKSGSHELSRPFKQLLDAFGVEWREAKGEAEAELAFLNRTGVVDAVLTDDVDALIFGALTVITNTNTPGSKAHPALNSKDKPSNTHVKVYTQQAVKKHDRIGLTRGGLILFALLAGGDYDKGAEKFGKVTAHALGRCNFGDQLLAAYENNPFNIEVFLRDWRTAVNFELRTNSRKLLTSARPGISLHHDFPNLDVLRKYVNPVNSYTSGSHGGGPMRDRSELDIGAVAAFCEEHFEWGYRQMLIKRLTKLLWPAALVRVLRRAAIEADEREKIKRERHGAGPLEIRGPLKPAATEAVGTPASLIKQLLGPKQRRATATTSRSEMEDRIASAFVNRGPAVAAPSRDDTTSFTRPTAPVDRANPAVLSILKSRRDHVHTDLKLEYQVEVSPDTFVELALAGIKGTRAPPPPDKDEEFSDERASIKCWVPESLLNSIHPDLEEQYLAAEEAKRVKKTTKGRGKAKPTQVVQDGEDATTGSPNPPAKSSRSKGKGKATTARREDREEGMQTDPRTIYQSSSHEHPGSSASVQGCQIGPEDFSPPSMDEDEDDDPNDPFTHLFNVAIGPKSGHAKKAPAPRRKRARAPEVDASSKRQKTYPEAPMYTSAPIAASSSSSLKAPNSLRPADRTRRASVPVARPQRRVADVNAMEISDSDDELPFSVIDLKRGSSSQFKRPVFEHSASSQESRLSFDDGDFIDLT